MQMQYSNAEKKLNAANKQNTKLVYTWWSGDNDNDVRWTLTQHFYEDHVFFYLPR